jgi:hypothetical protein
MSDTPTYASLLTRLFSGGPESRSAVLEYLRGHPADAHAVEAAVRDHLRDSDARPRLIAADALLRVYGDRTAATAVATRTLREAMLPWTAADVAALVRSLGEAAALDGAETWRELFRLTRREAYSAMLMGLADAARAAPHDLGPLDPTLRALRAVPSARAAAGAALWRVTWRVNRAWLETLDPGDDSLNYPGLRRFVLEVLIEHLGRRPDLAGLVREMLRVFANSDLPAATSVIMTRLVELGARGWSVLIPLLRLPVPDIIRVAIYQVAAERPAVLPLLHHHAHGVIVTTATSGTANILLPMAARVLVKLGPAAGTAVPDLLALAVSVPSTGAVVGATVSKIAAGFPNTPAAIVRALHRLRTLPYFTTEYLQVFQALGRALAELAPDSAPRLVENTAIDARVPDLLLQQPEWKNLPADTRRRHARMLADKLASPRAEVRIRAAELLRHYRDELPAVWPALVAVLAGSDEKVALAVLPYFRNLGPVADAVTPELVALFREPNPVYAARAVIALCRLGRVAEVAGALRAAVESGPDDGWGWTVLRGVIDRMSQAHGMLREVMDVFAASPADVVAKVTALLDSPESEREALLTACILRSGDPTAPASVDWNGVHREVGTDADGPLVYLALVCEYGSAGLVSHKIWMIKAQRGICGCGLAEAKGAVERVASLLPVAGSSAAERREAVRAFFTNRTELPAEVVKLLDHPVSWFRWAGLELADAWGLTPDQAAELTEDRVWDRSPRVRERALRMVRG